MFLAECLLCGTGFYISVYFTGIYYKLFSPHVFWVPRICRLSEKGCASVLETPRAKIFGIPNSALGIVLYSYLIFDVFFFPVWIGWFFLTLALLRSVYLVYSLLFITKIPCPLCFISHGINLVLFLLYTYQVFG